MVYQARGCLEVDFSISRSHNHSESAVPPFTKKKSTISLLAWMLSSHSKMGNKVGNGFGMDQFCRTYCASTIVLTAKQALQSHGNWQWFSPQTSPNPPVSLLFPYLRGRHRGKTGSVSRKTIHAFQFPVSLCRRWVQLSGAMVDYGELRSFRRRTDRSVAGIAFPRVEMNF